MALQGIGRIVRVARRVDRLVRRLALRAARDRATLRHLAVNLVAGRRVAHRAIRAHRELLCLGILHSGVELVLGCSEFIGQRIESGGDESALDLDVMEICRQFIELLDGRSCCLAFEYVLKLSGYLMLKIVLRLAGHVAD
ncbi:hypothetical protein Z951_33955 [Streptomyces sp. PRh5]|nr:hypothetical protein Z951_33955 [Streptomyces sp. PRh5]